MNDKTKKERFFLLLDIETRNKPCTIFESIFNPYDYQDIFDEHCSKIPELLTLYAFLKNMQEYIRNGETYE